MLFVTKNPDWRNLRENFGQSLGAVSGFNNFLEKGHFLLENMQKCVFLIFSAIPRKHYDSSAGVKTTGVSITFKICEIFLKKTEGP